MAIDKKQPISGQIPSEDRIKVGAIAEATNKKLHETDMTGTRGTEHTVDKSAVEEIIDNWPLLSKEVIETMIKFYGEPNTATETQVTWYYNGPWKRTIVYKDGYPHDFPEPHTDMLEQAINYHVPAEKIGELAMLEGSLFVDRTKGEVMVHCDNEGANTISMNVMHEIVQGKRTPDEARQKIKEQITQFLKGEPAPYAEKLLFDLPAEEKWDTDSPVVEDKELLQTIKEKKQSMNVENEKLV
ncbi:hypothetical protein [Virgibacillus sediminis]|uniref:Uncharacterized protein n=1 Tax=Virgibacillus sediminis TaxID=202260 RepID=A0ABV7A1K3_9BACI